MVRLDIEPVPDSFSETLDLESLPSEVLAPLSELLFSLVFRLELGLVGSFGGCSPDELLVEERWRELAPGSVGAEPRRGSSDAPEYEGNRDVEAVGVTPDSSDDSGVLFWRGVESEDAEGVFFRGNVNRSLYSVRSSSGDNETVIVGFARGVGDRAPEEPESKEVPREVSGGARALLDDAIDSTGGLALASALILRVRGWK